MATPIPMMMFALAHRSKLMRPFKHTTRGFTLIELMIVVAIVMILAATFTASTLVARQKARNVKAQAVTRELLNAIRLYDMTMGKLPDGFAPGTTIETTYAALRPLIDPTANSAKTVFFNAEIEENEPLLDPWENPYRIYIRQANTSAATDVYTTAVFLTSARYWEDLPNDETAEKNPY